MEAVRRVRAWLGPQGSVVALVALVLAVVLVGFVAVAVSRREADLRIGAVEDEAVREPAPTSTTGPAGTEAPGAEPGASADDGPGVGGTSRRRSGGGGGSYGSYGSLLDPDGRPYGAPVPFDATIAVPAGLVWVLVLGSDARPGEDPLRTRADSIHLLAADPSTGRGTVLGFPRDAWVDIPGHGQGKLNSALTFGGPELVAATVHHLTGLPVQWWALASFTTFAAVVDEVGGVDVHVDQAMDDPDGSGARFKVGWHHFDGAEALAFSRDRHDFADGDLRRSANQGAVVLAALAKLRAEVGDEAGLRTWLGVAFRHLALSVGRDDALQLLAVARRTDPAGVGNVVLPGDPGSIHGQSVIFLDARRSAAIADDLRPDATIGSARPGTSTSSSTTSTTTGGATSTSSSAPATTTTTRPIPGVTTPSTR